jgi:hypothetical protein
MMWNYGLYGLRVATRRTEKRSSVPGSSRYYGTASTVIIWQLMNGKGRGEGGGVLQLISLPCQIDDRSRRRGKLEWMGLA